MNDRKVYKIDEIPQDIADEIEKGYQGRPTPELDHLMFSIKDIVKDNRVYFVYYRQKVMYYGVDVDHQKYIFPVPLEDVMDASLFAEEKAITYMRYIRKALNDSTFVIAGCC